MKTSQLCQNPSLLFWSSPFPGSPWWSRRCRAGCRCWWPSPACPCGRWRCWTGCDPPPAGSPWTWCPSPQTEAPCRRSRCGRWSGRAEGRSAAPRTSDVRPEYIPDGTLRFSGIWLAWFFVGTLGMTLATVPSNCSMLMSSKMTVPWGSSLTSVATSLPCSARTRWSTSGGGSAMLS